MAFFLTEFSDQNHIIYAQAILTSTTRAGWVRIQINIVISSPILEVIVWIVPEMEGWFDAHQKQAQFCRYTTIASFRPAPTKRLYNNSTAGL